MIFLESIIKGGNRKTMIKEHQPESDKELVSTAIHIHFLGDFSISCQEQQLNSNHISTQLCSLIAFLAVHQNNTCNIEQIIDALFPNETKNPIAALKNQVYRCRKLFQNHNFPYGKDLILTTKNGYILNNELQIKVDTQELEDLCFSLDKKVISPDSLPLYMNLIELYKGNFLSSLSYQDWIDPYSRHYHNLFFSHIYKYMDYLLEKNEFKELYDLAKKLIFIDRYEERLHYYMILSLYKNQDSGSAVSYYQKVSNMFYNDLGVELSEDIQHLYNRISISSKMRHFDINTLRNVFQEGFQDDSNPFYCEFAVAKQIYQYQRRIYERTKLPLLIGIVSIHIHPQASENKELRIRAVTQLIESIRLNLRKGDLFSRCSSNQFVILLPNATSANQSVIFTRFSKHFSSNFISKYVHLTFEVDSFF